MISQVALDTFNITEDQVKAYLRKCDEVFDLPNGYAVRRGDIMHILAPQTALSGRKLIRKCQACLVRVHRNFQTIYAPVKKDNLKAQSFVKRIGFEESRTDDTHVWFAHRST